MLADNQPRIYVAEPNSDGEWRILYAAYHSGRKTESNVVGFTLAFAVCLVIGALMLGGPGL